MKLKISLLFLLISISVISQNITVKLIDEETKKPIPFANIKTGQHSGVISNNEGYFTISAENDDNTILISCMGYINKTLSIKDIKSLNYIVSLAQAINQLDEVYISNSTPNVDSIIAKVNATLTDNYKYNLNAYDVFHRSTDFVDFNSLEFEIDKASHVKKQTLVEVNESLTTLANQVKNSNMVQFNDFKGTVYALNKDSIKLKIDKATELLDHKNDFSIDNIQQKAQHLILTYLDTTKTYKLKTGLFKIEDSLSLRKEDFKSDNRNEFEVSYLNNRTKSMLKKSQFYKNSFLQTILNTDYYHYDLEDTGFNNGELTYIIKFTPRKSKAKYSGKIYVSEDTYAITRLDYSYYKQRHGEKFNLRLVLGVKYVENVSHGTILFERKSDETYHPKYISLTTGSYFYVSRPLKFIENSDNRYKVSFDFKIEGNNKSKEELLITKHQNITFLDFQAERQDAKTPIIKLNKYEKTIWDDEGILEPSAEMKAFEAKE